MLTRVILPHYTSYAIYRVSCKSGLSIDCCLLSSGQKLYTRTKETKKKIKNKRTKNKKDTSDRDRGSAKGSETETETVEEAMPAKESQVLENVVQCAEPIRVEPRRLPPLATCHLPLPNNRTPKTYNVKCRTMSTVPFERPTGPGPASSVCAPCPPPTLLAACW